MSERFRAYVSVQLLLIKDGQILLQRRYKTGYQDGWYGLVSGHLDGGESTTTALIREAQEEAGTTIVAENLTVSHVMHRFNPDREYIDIFLTATAWEGEPRIMEHEKCDDLRWFSIDQLPENTIDYIKKAIENHANGQTFSEFGW